MEAAAGAQGVTAGAAARAGPAAGWVGAGTPWGRVEAFGDALAQ